MRTVFRAAIAPLLMVLLTSCVRWEEVRPGDGAFAVKIPNVESCTSSSGPKRWGSLKKWECKGANFTMLPKHFALYSAYLYQLPAGHGLADVRDWVTAARAASDKRTGSVTLQFDEVELGGETWLRTITDGREAEDRSRSIDLYAVRAGSLFRLSIFSDADESSSKKAERFFHTFRLLGPSELAQPTKPRCWDQSIASYDSPDKRHDALVFVTECGPTTEKSIQVAIESHFGLFSKRVFIADTGNGVSKPTPFGGARVRVKWLDSETLEIRFDRLARVLRRDQSAYGISLRYVEVGDEQKWSWEKAE